MAVELLDLEVDRVDGVDKPATGRKFLIQKSEEPDEVKANLDQLVKAGTGALESLAKQDILALSPETAKALNTLAKLLEFGSEFKAKKPEEYGYEKPKAKAGDKDKEMEDEKDKEKDKKREHGYMYPEPRTKAQEEAFVTSIAEKTGEAVAKTLGPTLEKIAGALDGKVVIKVAPKSKQAEGQDKEDEDGKVEKSVVPEFGKGMFRQVIFGDKGKN